MTIEWRAIAGYEGYYEVSSTGLVRSLDRVVTTSNGYTSARRGRVLTPTTAKRGGYPVVTLTKYGLGAPRKVHHLVLEAFVGPRPPGMMCCHFDGDPTNNCIENLRWDTGSSNNQDAVRHGTFAQTAKTYCPNRHELTPDNIYSPPGTDYRGCRRCRTDRSSSRAAELRQKRRLQGIPANQQYSSRDIADIKAAREAGETYQEIATRYPFSKATVRRICLDEAKGRNG